MTAPPFELLFILLVAAGGISGAIVSIVEYNNAIKRK